MLPGVCVDGLAHPTSQAEECGGPWALHLIYFVIIIDFHSHSFSFYCHLIYPIFYVIKKNTRKNNAKKITLQILNKTALKSTLVYYTLVTNTLIIKTTVIKLVNKKKLIFLAL